MQVIDIDWFEPHAYVTGCSSNITISDVCGRSRGYVLKASIDEDEVHATANILRSGNWFKINNTNCRVVKRGINKRTTALIFEAVPVRVMKRRGSAEIPDAKRRRH